jgi:hypothetical protein
MLIYQLDAFAFDNQLDYWCSKDFEYIGAPVCPNYWYKPTCFYMNGGFSLRKISACCNAFRGYGWYRLILQGARAFPIPYKSLQLVKEIYSLLAAFCLKHQIPIVFNKLMHEDLLWTTALGQKTDYQDAARFAWEAQPEMLFQQIGHLPFGCHAWERYEYESFWSQHGIK